MRLAVPGLLALAASNHADTRVVDGVEAPALERQERPVAQVDVVGLKRGRLPPAVAPLTVDGGKVAERQHPYRALGHHLANPGADRQDRCCLPRICGAHLGEASQGDLAHSAQGEGLNEERAHARGVHTNTEISLRREPGHECGAKSPRGWCK